ncbi:MAG: YbaK/EbsC family protein [Acidiferrobacterales bacterium]|nr:YbaK/EbsC family protein [Acidiferrobacterales bacterium]
MNPANIRVKSALAQMNIPCEITIVEHDTRTSAQAAETLGCSIAQIAKSLIFTAGDGDAVLAVTSGANRVCTDLLADLVGQPIGKANAEFVRHTTGFVIGGVAPAGLAHPVRTVFDRDLFVHETVWAAAGTPNSLFPISRKNLRVLAGDRIRNFTQPLV